MANNIELAKKYGPSLDKIYKLASKTARMDGAVSPVSFTNAATVEFLKISVVGLGNYDRNVGYPKGDVTATWEAWTLCFNTLQNYTPLKHVPTMSVFMFSFNTLQNYTPLKHDLKTQAIADSFNTLQNYTPLKRFN